VIAFQQERSHRMLAGHVADGLEGHVFYRAEDAPRSLCERLGSFDQFGLHTGETLHCTPQLGNNRP